ncbi:hypothetical protein [Dyadobacter sp. CY323]|uniref:hypothetical protein n=1 Tax=Dyadobacter sp. CY323 TaxID=2907302 RepID=UPI001F44D986|nr:hypothetical protein [Dyadobacter sp. CY323]MCE6987503.1 hypothetical protein [Dyadobacter sp. CY323]
MENSENAFQPHLETFFTSINSLKTKSSHVEGLLSRSMNDYEKNYKDFPVKTLSFTALIISDWSGEHPGNWVVRKHTGIIDSITLDNYRDETKKIISFHCCSTFAQCFERLSSFLKDIAIENGRIHPETLNYSDKSTKEIKIYNRQTIPGGDAIFDIIKASSDGLLMKYSKENVFKIKFTEFWKVISVFRHSITHSSSIFPVNKIPQSIYYNTLLQYLFPNTEIHQSNIHIILEFGDLSKLVSTLAEFAFQIFKIYSIKEKMEWDIYK